ncbi:MAG: hypothetical protein HYX44_14965 [Aquabacterium sp.]|nr:hypothetical protein [Aquabacterium sp.]
MNAIRPTGQPDGGLLAQPHQLAVAYHDGLTARAHAMLMWVEGGMLQLSGPGLIRQVPLSKVHWSERTRHGTRMAHFHDGGTVQAVNAADWDRWLDHHELGAPARASAASSGRWSFLAAAVMLMVAVLGCWWGQPPAAKWVGPLARPIVAQQADSQGPTQHAKPDQSTVGAVNGLNPPY